MEDRVQSLREMYAGFKRGEMEAVAVRNEARVVLQEAKKKGDVKTLNEVEDILLDLEFSIEETRC